MWRRSSVKACVEGVETIRVALLTCRPWRIAIASKKPSFGGLARNRTGVQGFAVASVTIFQALDN
jgi:hypothetical protein